ncbi:MAG: hypothetical protein PHR10_10130 [Sphaerochaetaceae bacterium]|jgi:hypothetical protein|nr:hypothetical protein [Sphaerochaetaceae bacterium]
MKLILDNTVLVNFIDHCTIPDFIDLLLQYPFELCIVQTVNEEYEKGLRRRPFATNPKRFYQYVRSKISVIDDTTIPPNVPEHFLGLDAGELMSAMYKLQVGTSAILCTDDLAAHKAMLSYNQKKCLWTSDLLVMLHKKDPSLIRRREARDAYKEIVKNGFIGIPPDKIDFDAVYDIDYYV